VKLLPDRTNREREKESPKYQAFKQRAHPLVKAMQDAALNHPPADIIRTQPVKWLIFGLCHFTAWRPRNPRLQITPNEQWQLPATMGSGSRHEYPYLRQARLASAWLRKQISNTVIVNEAPQMLILPRRIRWDDFAGTGKPA